MTYQAGLMYIMFCFMLIYTKCNILPKYWHILGVMQVQKAQELISRGAAMGNILCIFWDVVVFILQSLFISFKEI